MKNTMVKNNKNEINYDINMSWKIIESYFKGQHLARLVRHQIESYNYFVNHQINKTIDMFNPVVIHSEHDKDPETGIYSLELIITFENFQLYRPLIHENNGAHKNYVSTGSSFKKFHIFFKYGI